MLNRKIAAALVSLAALPVLVVPAPARPESLAHVDAVCTLRDADRMTTTSRRCLSCHDGSIASSHVSLAEHASIERNHPVDIVYAASLALRPRTLNARHDIPRNLVLPDGRVTCTTCHDGASSEPFRVAVPMHGSRLCFGCHNL